MTYVSEVFGDFMDWMKSQNDKFQVFEQTSLPDNQIEIEKLMNQHETFLESFAPCNSILDAISGQTWRTPNNFVQK